MRSIEYKRPAELKRMAESGVVLREALDETVAAAQPGVTTLELDATFRKVLQRHGASSNFLGYYGFPATVCTSVNEEVVHGIPGERVLKSGDVLKVDGGAIVDGWHSDSARTVLVDGGSDADQRLSDITEEAMWAGIAAAASARFVGQIGQAVEASANAQGGHDLGILEEYCGHGIGSEMHMAPDVLNYAADYRGPRIKTGMALAIEPMLVTGGLETKTLADDWTIVTTDGGHASQWEHTVLFHRGGIWVATAENGGAERLARYGVTPAEVQA